MSLSIKLWGCNNNNPSDYPRDYLHSQIQAENKHITITAKILKRQITLKAKDLLPNINRKQDAERAEKCHFYPWCPWPLTLTFKLVQGRDQTHLLWECGTNPFSGSQDTSYTRKKPQTDGAKNRTFCSSMHVIKTTWKLVLFQMNRDKQTLGLFYTTACLTYQQFSIIRRILLIFKYK